ncbi:MULTISPECIES: toxin-antitoxin system, antitoxin component, AbrB family protein [Lactobacillus]|nr:MULTISPECIES: toxin-antitoxin system, antitoxin component, AbrB family protein [Lactobacillus]
MQRTNNTNATEHDHKMIEASFQDFENQGWLAEQEMCDKFGKFGWTED